MKLPYPVKVEILREFPIFFSCIPVDLLDDDKRPLLEGRSIYHKPAASDYSTCQYQGKRKKHPYRMNKEALRLAWQNADEIIHTLQLLKSQAINLRKISSVKATRADELYAAALSGFKTANYYLADSVLNNSNFTYPPYLSALSKICHGLCHLIYNCDKRIINYCCDTNKIDVLYHHIDSQELLVGHQTQEVCAGPAIMIKKVLAIFTNNTQPEGKGKVSPAVMNYYLYASITSLFELLSCHYEFYNICNYRALNKSPEKIHTIPYSNYLHSTRDNSIVKDIPVLGKLADLAWYNKGYEDIADAIKRVIDKIECDIESKDFSDKNKIDSDCLNLFNQLNNELYRLFYVKKTSRMDLHHLSFFFNTSSN